MILNYGVLSGTPNPNTEDTNTKRSILGNLLQSSIRHDYLNSCDPDSIIEKGVNSGFGYNDTLVVEKPLIANLVTPIYKENFFKEFASELEKFMARQNLGIVGKEEVEQYRDQLGKELTLQIQDSLDGALNSKQNSLLSGYGIVIKDDVISVNIDLITADTQGEITVETVGELTFNI